MQFENLQDRLISPKEAVKITSTSIATIHRWIAAGKFSVVKIGPRCTRIDGNSLASFLADNTAAKVEA